MTSQPALIPHEGIAACRETLDKTERVQLARARKAQAIAAFLRDKGVTASEAARLDQRGRYAAARLAGQRAASEKTWAEVVRRMRRRVT
jgi:hypothetical protein